MQRTAPLAALLAIGLAATLTACGDDETPTPSPDVSDDTSSDATPDVTEDVADDATPDTPSPDTENDTPAETDGTDDDDVPPDTDTDTGEPEPDPEADCDPIDPSYCSLPWPSNLYLVEDSSRDTGFRLQFGETSLPANRRGRHVDPTQFARMDGYALGTAAKVIFPNIDISGYASEYNMAASMDEDAQILFARVLDDGTLERIPYWVELDARGEGPDETMLYVWPGVILEEGARYVVAFGRIADTNGTRFARSEAFDALLRGDTAENPRLAPRQARFDEVFAMLEDAGWERDDITLAWDFVTASGRALHAPMLRIRDLALEAGGDDGPPITCTVEELTEAQNANIALRFACSLEVPEYVQGTRFNSSVNAWNFVLDEEGLPTQVGTRTVNFDFYVPRSGLDGEPIGLIQYGHGLLGTGSQVYSSNKVRLAQEHRFAHYASDLTGMATGDVPTVIALLGDMSHFHWLSDRIHQGFAEWLVIHKAVNAQMPDHPEITSRGIVIDRNDSWYTGISQGGIYGVPYVALNPNITRGHFGVPGNNYSILLDRSVDFDGYAVLLRNAYPRRIDQGIILGAVQSMWDMVDPITYLRHLEHEPFPGSGPSIGLFAPAKGDWQVHVPTNEIAARTNISIPLLENYDQERTDIFGIEYATYPHTGSGVVLYDYGNPWPAESVNFPPNDDIGDPHGKPRRERFHDEQIVTFLREGIIIDVCGGDGCTPD